MSSAVKRTPKSGRQSLFYQDLATPVSARKSSGKFTTPGQAAAVSALWRENFANSDLPPPPAFTLEDRADFSPESGMAHYPMSPDLKSDPRTPLQSSGKEFSASKSRSDVSTSYALMGKQQSQQTLGASSSWWSPTRSGGSAEHDDKGKGSPVDGVVQPGALITLPPPREVARPEVQRNVDPIGRLNEEEWVTVYGFYPADTNLVLREFEKCGMILKHIPGPRDANWIHILYQNRADANRALSKNGTQINGVLMIGVKLVDPLQRQALIERMNNQGFMTLPRAQTPESNHLRLSTYPLYPQNENSGSRHSAGMVAAPAKSVMSKVMDLMFGV